jgi:methyl-accepting chemotaxis protein
MGPESVKATRKKMYLVNRDFQFRYTGAAIIVGIMSTLLTSVVILYPLYRFEILRIPQFLPLPILLVMVFATLINIFLVGFMGIFMTHRIAGPMYGMVRYIRAVEEGKLYGRMKIRDGDELGFLVRNFNAMLISLSEAAENDLQMVKSIEAEFKKIPGLESHGSISTMLLELQNRFENRLSDRPLGSDEVSND